MAKVALVTPPQLYTLTQLASVALPPIGGAYIASYLRSLGHQVTVIDGFGSAMDYFTKRGDFHLRGLTLPQIIERIPLDVDVIAVSNMFSHGWPVVRDLTRDIKRVFPKIPVVTGGVHPTALSAFVLSHGNIDYCVLGEGEATMGELVERLMNERDVSDMDGLAYMGKDGQPKKNEKTQLIQDLDTLPFPGYEMLPIESYIVAANPHGAARGRWMPLIATRGCPYVCTFCTAEEMWIPKWRSRSPENLVDEMEHWNKTYRITDFHFEDLTIVLQKQWALKFCNEIMNRGLKITWQMPNGTRSEAVDDEVIEHLKVSGCTNITFAPESGSPRTLKLIKKELDPEVLVAACKRALKKDMVVCCFFIVGFPHETMEEIRETFKFIRWLARVGVNEISITAFTALPGSALFRQLMEEGRITLDDKFFRELLYMSDLSWAPSWIPGVTDEQIAGLRRWGYAQFFFINYLYHPSRLFRTAWNIMRGVSENKVERVGHEKMQALRQMMRRFIRRSPAGSSATAPALVEA
ncbi:MAG: radical SAM protein [Acidobacteriota bacterium]